MVCWRLSSVACKSLLLNVHCCVCCVLRFFVAVLDFQGKETESLMSLTTATWLRGHKRRRYWAVGVLTCLIRTKTRKTIHNRIFELNSNRNLATWETYHNNVIKILSWSYDYPKVKASKETQETLKNSPSRWVFEVHGWHPTLHLVWLCRWGGISDFFANWGKGLGLHGTQEGLKAPN